MNKDRAVGAAKTQAGKLVQAVAKATKNPKLQVKGIVKEAEGRVQSVVGKFKDAANRAVKR